MLLADFVRRADRRGTSERTSGGKAVTGATGSICHHRLPVKRIFKLFLGQQPRFSRFPPVFRLFVRTGETTKLPFFRNLQTHFRLRFHKPKNTENFCHSQNEMHSIPEFASATPLVDFESLEIAPRRDVFSWSSNPHRHFSPILHSPLPSTLRSPRPLW
jgi:hypothetical protein